MSAGFTEEQIFNERIFWYISQVPGVSGRHTTTAGFYPRRGTLPSVPVFLPARARRTSSAVETSRYCALTCRYLDKTPTNNRSRDSHSAASTQQCNRLSGARCSMVRLQVLTFQRRGHCCWCESPRKIDECR